MRPTLDGAYIMVGTSTSSDGDVKSNRGYYDVWILKIDTLGNVIWTKSLGGGSTDGARSVQSTTDGGYIVGATTSSFDGDVTTRGGNRFDSDFWIIKLSNSGTVQWQKCLGGSKSDAVYSIQNTSDDGYIVVGSSESNDGDVSGHHIEPIFVSRDYWIVKLNNAGNIQWQKSLGGTRDDVATHVEQTSDGGYIVAGYTYSNDGDVTNFHNSGGTGGADYWIVKLTSTGVIQWQKCMGGNFGDGAWDIKQTNEGGFIVVGSTNSVDGDVSSNHGIDDYWIVKLDISGNISWQKTFGGSKNDIALSVKQNNSGGYLVMGYSSSNNDNVTINNGSFDYWILQINSTGNIEWEKNLGGSLDEVGYSIESTRDSGFITAGVTYSNDLDVKGSHGGIDGWVVKLKQMPCVPSVNITTSSTSSCASTLTTFTATPTNGGTSPTYQWKVNGLNSGTNSATYTSSTLNNNDVVTCELTSNATCVTTPTVTSNAIKITVYSPPVVSITGDTCVGGVLTVNSNSTPSSLAWTLNGITKVSTQTAGFQPNAVTVAGGNGMGTNANQLNKPTHFFVDAAGNMYIPDMDNNRIQKWTPGASAGVTVAGGRGAGSALNQLDRPTSVAIDSKGNLYVTDQNNNRVLKYAAGSTTGVLFGNYFSTPTDIIIDANDNIYISEQNNSVVTKFPAGSSTGVRVAGGNGYGSAANQFSTPTGMYVDAAGNIYVCDTDNNRVQKWAPGATTGITVAGGNGNGSAPNQLAYPLGVFVDTYGNVYVADYFNARVQKWAPGATSGTTIAGGNGAGAASNQLNRPESVWLNAFGDLFVADLANNRVQKFSNTLTKTYTTLKTGDYTATVTSGNGCVATSNTITVVASRTPSVTITSDATAICEGVTITFTASPVDGGSNPTYQWKINGSNIGSTNTSIFQTSNLKAGDVVSCVMTSNASYCLTSKTATSNLITMTNASAGVASVTITASDTVICAGSTVKFTAVPVNGGSTPKYDWKINGIAQATNTPTFSTAALVNGDVISCVLTSSANLCPASLIAISNAITIKSIPVSVALVSIVANDTLICTGSRVDFTANAINGGSNPVYQWQLNGANASANSSVYASNSLNNNDVISCSLTSNMQCASSPVQSNKITMTVDDVPLIKMPNDTTIFAGSSIKLNTVVTGNVSSYTWSPSSTLSNSTIVSPTATPNITTTYKLLVNTPGDCKANGAVTIITITQVDIPNAFSPNGDGVNDVWRIAGLSSYAGCTVEVFNRYGQIVFQSRGYNTPWNGTFKGHYIPVGTYYYIITTDKTTKPRTGFVTVLQ